MPNYCVMLRNQKLRGEKKKKWNQRNMWADTEQVFIFLFFFIFQSMSRSTQVWCADQSQTGCFVVEQAALWAFLVENKQTENVWNVPWPINLTVRRGVSESPPAAGGHDYAQQTRRKHSRLSQPFKRTRPSFSPPLYLVPLGVPVGCGREGTEQNSVFYVSLKPDFFSPLFS